MAGLLLTLVGIDLLSKRAMANWPDVFVGVDVGFGDESDVYRVADAVEGYANLIVIGSLDVTNDSAKLTRVCDYLYNKGFYFMVYVGYRAGLFPPRGPDLSFFNAAAPRWGDRLLGVYMLDEPGGKQLDYSVSNPDKIVPSAHNFSDAALHFVINLKSYLLLYQDTYYNASEVKMFTSDYVLHWYDYLSGYDVIFGEFVGNQSRQLEVALNRGAAHTLGKDWGVMITWKYMQPPFMEEPEQLYDDMILAYQNGAKYIVVFNSPDEFPRTTPYGILTTEHLDKIKKFWSYTKTNPRTGEYLADTAYVLPKDYGYGFRGPDDNIWGLWHADALSPKIWNDTGNLLARYGMNLDIVYETKIEDVPINLPYKTLIFWNGTTIER